MKPFNHSRIHSATESFSPVAGILLVETNKDFLMQYQVIVRFSPVAGILLVETRSARFLSVYMYNSFSPVAGILLVEPR